MSQNNTGDTIFALSSAPGRGGVAVLRVSGPNALGGLKNLVPEKEFPERQAVFCEFADKTKPIDRGLALFFKGPKSFTGEDIVEYHVHGGKAVIDALLRVLAKQKNHRLAEPGEFTKRAFQNGKLDLTAAEGIADLINAETQGQHEQALLQMGGALEKLYGGWAKQLTHALAHQEAEIEFPEDDMPDGITEALRPEIKKLLGEITVHLDDNHRGERLRDGILITIVGAPNAGKSSLMNALARRDVAIVSETAGTTRDVIEAHLDLAGYPVIIADTAGLHEKTSDAIEIEGMSRARKKANEADFKLAVFDASCAPDPETLAYLKDKTTIALWNKSDLATIKNSGIAISAKTGSGIPELLALLVQKIRAFYGEYSTKTPALSRPRHRQLVNDCQDCLIRSLNTKLPELAAEDLRLALRSLGKLTGRVDVEDLLDIIFRDFCIGK